MRRSRADRTDSMFTRPEQSLLRELARGLYESIRETLPSTEQEAGAFLSGMVWAFLVFWVTVFIATYLTLLGRGVGA
jgi:hypothetical protein